MPAIARLSSSFKVGGASVATMLRLRPKGEDEVLGDVHTTLLDFGAKESPNSLDCRAKHASKKRDTCFIVEKQVL